MHWPQWFNKFLHHNVSLMQRSNTLDGEPAGRRDAALEHSEFK
jgi:hypothetical protein